MEPDAIKAQDTEIKNPVNTEGDATTKVESQGDAVKVGDLLPKSESVPLSTFLSIKNEKKELENIAKEAITRTQQLEQEIENLRRNGTNSNTDDADVMSIANDYGVDPDLLKKVVEASNKKATANLESLIESKLGNIQSKEKQEAKMQEDFNSALEQALNELPDEYKQHINKNTIKQLAYLPENHNKEFKKIIEDTYGFALAGKSTLETNTTIRGGKEPKTLNFEKAMKDPEYLESIKQNDLKAFESYKQQLLIKISSMN